MARVLLVDDQPLNILLLRAHLEPLGHEVSEATSGEEALVKAALHPPDLVLLDVMLPGISGFATLRALKDLAKPDLLPVMLVTALNEPAPEARGFEDGADDFLTKPFDATVLKLRVRNLLALRAERMALVKRNAELAELQRYKQEMVGLLVHDLKNPATVIAMNIDFARNALEGTADESVHEALIDARAGCKQLLRLCANMLDLSRSEESHLELHSATVDLASLISPLLQPRLLLARKSHVDVEIDLEPGIVLTIDPDLISRVIDNLVDNAFHHATRGGKVRVRTRVVGDEVEIRVSNTGSPIPKEHWGTVFEKYAQFTGETPRLLSAGLGLFFCRLAAEAHGGNARIIEEEDLPVTFVVSLPFQQGAKSGPFLKSAGAMARSSLHETLAAPTRDAVGSK